MARKEEAILKAWGYNSAEKVESGMQQLGAAKRIVDGEADTEKQHRPAAAGTPVRMPRNDSGNCRGDGNMCRDLCTNKQWWEQGWQQRRWWVSHNSVVHGDRCARAPRMVDGRQDQKRPRSVRKQLRVHGSGHNWERGQAGRVSGGAVGKSRCREEEKSKFCGDSKGERRDASDDKTAKDKVRVIGPGSSVKEVLKGSARDSFSWLELGSRPEARKTEKEEKGNRLSSARHGGMCSDKQIQRKGVEDEATTTAEATKPSKGTVNEFNFVKQLCFGGG
ncbi:hypothetical protein C8F04DRAFT_1185629 [Mycena alexandri]|uniref:Uncharacterized protein n=1 Tax=Mycena alexandri TaxID=1745969 RepID=A0AAD6SPG3_9AGAR|nr:hypothetical protein C8F04DRAFT_1185629 [Mycena alexandri]